jgi:hypothetical protein
MDGLRPVGGDAGTGARGGLIAGKGRGSTSILPGTDRDQITAVS